ncbi:MAG TPA: DNA mismatch repair endonuclease MutL, partial [Candidatus Dormibacteraeota bacterium]|nr:DNA mismatch repair endonuclease MutL [Candidatus Dormibacteraeota bacterium]
GVVAEAGPAAAPPGTAVEVSELFAVTPARLRFLREVRTEAAHASRVVAELALTHPHVAFSCSVDGRSSVRTSGGTLQGALLEVLGARAGAELVEVASDGPVRVSGCISPPLQHRGTRAGIVLVVNGRRVHNRSLLAAMEEAYAGLLPQHRHPFGVVAVELDPTEVDVNVHPAKRDVRFRSDRAVYAAVQRACWSALRGQQVRAGALPAPDEWAVGTAVSAVPLSFEDGSDGFASNESTDGTGALVGALTAVGQVGGEWIVAEGDDGVVFVDPHAAHEKILYVELLERWSRADAGSQLLLMPAVVECDSAQMAQAHEHAAFLSGCGFDVEEFGPQTLRCSAVPATAVNADAAELLRDLLDSLGAAAAGPREERAAAVVACHAAVRFGDRLGAAEQQRLLDRLATTPGGRTCPHGRPTMLGLTESFLRRAFRRPDR